jgi:REP element-mobilizing transposase RayT
MKPDSQVHHRRSIRLSGFDYSQPGGYFITIVTYQRECLFGKIENEEMVLSNFGRVAKQQWEKLSFRFHNIELSSFVVMPNHVHGIIMIHDNGRGIARGFFVKVYQVPRYAPTVQQQFGKLIPGSIPTIVRSYKSAVSYRINLMRNTAHIPVWQRNYYEHIVRNQTDLENIDRYVQFNPIQWFKDEENPEWQNHH